jgi:hypothetical protein
MTAARRLTLNTIRVVLWCFFSLVVLSTLAAEGTALVFSPAEWQLGSLHGGDRVSVTVHVKNTTGGPVSLNVISSCDCLRAEPAELVIPARSSAGIKLSFHAAENYAGPIRMTYIIETDVKGADAIFYRVLGTVVKK